SGSSLPARSFARSQPHGLPQPARAGAIEDPDDQLVLRITRLEKLRHVEFEGLIPPVLAHVVRADFLAIEPNRGAFISSADVKDHFLRAVGQAEVRTKPA